MPFLRFEADRYEWGFEVEPGFVPAVGDTVELCHAPPDEEADDSITATVVSRHWYFWGDFAKWRDIILEVKLEEPLPEGHVPDCTAWPSASWSERKQR
jgi:hypothetical protein